MFRRNFNETRVGRIPTGEAVLAAEATELVNVCDADLYHEDALTIGKLVTSESVMTATQRPNANTQAFSRSISSLEA